jgi:hypothetical protein
VNDSRQFSLQLFAFLVSFPIDYPENMVMLDDWKDNTENAQLQFQLQQGRKRQ